MGTIGVEGQTGVGPFHVYGQAGYTDTLAWSGDDKLRAYYAHLETRYFLEPNLMLSADAGYSRAKEIYEDEPHDLWRWGLNLEWRAPSSWWGAFVSYQGVFDHETGTSIDDFTNHSVFAGLTIHFDPGTLESKSESDATLKNFNPFTGVNHVRMFDWN